MPAPIAVEYATLLTRLVVVGGLRTAQRRALEEGLLRDGGAQAEARGRDQLAEVERVGADVLVLGDSDYPARPGSIVDAPPIMFARGRREPDTRAVACVGTRSPTDFGRTAALRLSETLAREGWTVVSGLALGIDTVAHEAALAVGGRTVAVLGNGLETVYPAANRLLAERIVQAGGLLLSEQPCGTPALARNLVARDRLQSGLAVATILFESSITGGAMHTARFAREQGRLLACAVPPARYATIDSTSGNRELLRREDACPVHGRDDYPALLTRLEREAIEAAAPRPADSADMPIRWDCQEFDRLVPSA
jgi:DNA protecting protein DprA